MLKINHFDFENKFDKTHANVKYFLPEDCYKNFLTNWKRNEQLNNFLGSFGTIGSISSRPFCAIFSFTR